MLMWFIVLLASGNDGSGAGSIPGTPLTQDDRRRRRIPRIRIRRG